MHERGLHPHAVAFMTEEFPQDFEAEEDPQQTRERLVQLGFDGDEDRFQRFVNLLRDELPSEVCVIVRGSAVAGSRWVDGAPFDADGKGSSDLDVTFVGATMLKFWEKYYIPGLHTAPLCDEDLEAAPDLVPLREKLTKLAGRPVNLQATSDLVQFVRDVTTRQPYYVLIEKAEEPERAAGADDELTEDSLPVEG